MRFAALAVVPALALGAIAVATARGDEPPPPTLIVTDVRDESGSPAGRRLAFALPELLIVNLGQYPRGPLIRLRGTDDPGLAESTERAVLSGRIVRDGASLAVFASLKRVEDGRVLWSDSYPISDATLATHARDIAGSAAVALGADLQPPPVEAGATPRSQALYWEARQLAGARRAALTYASSRDSNNRLRHLSRWPVPRRRGAHGSVCSGKPSGGRGRA